VHFFVPEVVDYELRRELLRAGKTAAIGRLDAFNSAIPARYGPLTTTSIRLAAQLWADLRNRGLPTSNPEELDVDVILAAQALNSGFPAGDVVVATSNPAHLSRLVTANLWMNI
jgi:predicted nucleic acid-binding protein